jgi:hypothetical protein
MKKIGIFCLALVVAIGALGVGYAAWTDSIFINGTVKTGSVDIDVVAVSGSTIWKDLDPRAPLNNMQTYRWLDNITGDLPERRVAEIGTNPDQVATSYVVAWAETEYIDDDEIAITFHNAFPQDCPHNLYADFIVHYEGSVPAIVTARAECVDPMLEKLYESGYVDIRAWKVDYDPFPFYFDINEPIEGPIQMHYCDYAKVWVFLDLPQKGAELDAFNDYHGTDYVQEDFMNKTWHFKAYIDATQWNEVALP